MQLPEVTSVLNRLLAPVTREGFFAQYWGRRTLHVERNIRGHFDDILRLADIDAFLQSEMNPAAFLNVVRGGTTVDAEKWSRVRKSARGVALVGVPDRLFSLYHEGATLVVNHVHQTIPAAGVLARRLFQELEYEVGMNVYITPSGGEGFTRHSDGHEVVVLQLSGAKCWTVYPLTEDSGAGTTVDLMLQEGDLLYIPRGQEHSAHCGESPSIHLTIGIHAWYGFRLLEQLAERARQNPAFGRPAPAKFADGADKERYETGFRNALRDIAADAQVESLLIDLRAKLATLQTMSGMPRLGDAVRLTDIRGTTVVQLPAGMSPFVECKGTALRLTAEGRSLTAPLFLRTAIEQVLEGSAFQVNEWRGMLTAQGRVELAQRMVRSGILTIVRI